MSVKDFMMKVYVDGKLYDSEETIVVLVFEDDEQKQQVIEHLHSMPEKEGGAGLRAVP